MTPVITYILTITGAPDSTTDVTLPMKSFQGRKKNTGEVSYLSVVMSDITKIEPFISARLNGELVIVLSKITDDIQNLYEIFRASISDVSLSEGGARSSVVVSGYLTEPARTPSTLLMDKISFIGSSPEGDFRFRAPVNELQPGDTAVVESINRTVYSISYQVSATFASMEVTCGS